MHIFAFEAKIHILKGKLMWSKLKHRDISDLGLNIRKPRIDGKTEM